MNNVQIIAKATEVYGEKVNTLFNWRHEGYSVPKGTKPIGTVFELTGEKGLWKRGQNGKFYQSDAMGFSLLYAESDVVPIEKKPETPKKQANKGKKSTPKKSTAKSDDKKPAPKKSGNKKSAPKGQADVEKFVREHLDEIMAVLEQMVAEG